MPPTRSTCPAACEDRSRASTAGRSSGWLRGQFRDVLRRASSDPGSLERGLASTSPRQRRCVFGCGARVYARVYTRTRCRNTCWRERLATPLLGRRCRLIACSTCGRDVLDAGVWEERREQCREHGRDEDLAVLRVDHDRAREHQPDPDVGREHRRRVLGVAHFHDGHRLAREAMLGERRGDVVHELNAKAVLGSLVLRPR